MEILMIWITAHKSQKIFYRKCQNLDLIDINVIVLNRKRENMPKCVFDRKACCYVSLFHNSI